MADSPMKSLHQELPFEEFRTFPMRLGFKHEYYGGKVHQTPNHSASVVLQITLSRRPTPARWRVRPIDDADRPALIEVYEQAFRGYIYFADYTDAMFRKEAREAVNGFLANHDRARRSCSFAAEDGARVELERHRKLGDLTPEELTALRRQYAQWRAKAKRLHAREQKDFKSVHPILMLHGHDV